MRGLIIRWALVTLAFMILPYIVPGIEVQNIWAALAAAAVLGILNLFFKPILFLLTLPLTVLSLGLFLFILNGIVLYLVGGIVNGVHIDGFVSAILGSLVLSLMNLATNLSLAKHGNRRVVIIRGHHSPQGNPRVRDLN